MLSNVKTYHRPTKLEDAVALVQSNPNSAYVGGGSWITAQGDPTLEVLVDLSQAGLGTIETSMEEARIGAAVPLQAVIDHSDLAGFADGVLATAIGYIQSRNLREQGTIGGTLIVADAADPLTTVLLAMDSELSYADPLVHTAPFASFVAYRDRLTKTRVLLTQLKVRRPAARTAMAFEVVGRSPKDKPIVCAAAYVQVDEGLPMAVRIAVGGADATPVRLHKAEHLLKGQLLTEEKVLAALDVALPELHPVADFRGSAEYRMAMARVLARRAILGAWQKARR